MRNDFRLKPRLALLTIVLWMPLAGFGQAPPPNDNFNNAIVLTGTDVTFAGGLAGATVEDYREAYTLGTFFGPFPTRSVWWTWTASNDAILSLQILNYSSGLTIPQNGSNGIAVYTATNGSTSPDGLILPALGSLPLFYQFTPLSFAIPVTAGANYYIQFCGDSPATCTFRLVATNTPVIDRQPRSQTVSSNASALFYVIPAGTNMSAFTYQWCFNGTNLVGQTAPMMALTNIDGSMDGAYTVIVSNSTGLTVSDPAMLSVSQSNFPVSLAAIGMSSNSFVFSVTGEPGRTYLLQSSTNLVNWTAEKSFALDPFSITNVTSIFHQTNSQITLAVTNSGASKFFRVTPYLIGSPDAEVCINNLRQIRITKLFWQRQSGAVPVAAPTTSDIVSYFSHQALPFCPDDSGQMFDDSYVINDLVHEPRCEIHPNTHVLQDPP
jgi:hypothetical protein